MKTSKVKGARGSFHLELSEGACVVRIYTSVQRKAGKGRYTTYRLVYDEGGVRQREGFGDLDEAKGQAQLVLTRLLNGETAAQGLRAVEFQAYAIAKEEVAKVGSNVVDASREYRKARERLGDKGTILEAVDYFLKHARPDIPAKKIPEIIAELLAAKEADKRSTAYLADLKMRLGKFSKSFSGAIGEVTTKEIENWLRSFGSSSKNRNNYANVVTTLFNFAKRYDYLPKESATAAEDLSRAKDEGGEVAIYSVSETKLLLRRAVLFRPELVPYLAIGAFAGVRPAEVLRMSWSEIDWESRLIEIKGAKAKTAGRRHVPISNNLFAWLAPFRESTGPICDDDDAQGHLRAVVERELVEGEGREAGVAWKPNALRHSYGSYRLPVIKNASELALEMGNSARMIFRHYRELVKPVQAEEYWKIMPENNWLKPSSFGSLG